ncbi:MAG: hypothetical protein JWP00_3191 [Chloroflexi bacterium]|jgi:hypothetical protein|nr:hypothetical protein [Chloroflexota bacterium]
MPPERSEKLDSLARYMQEQQAEYNRLEEEKAQLFREAAQRQRLARHAESRPPPEEQLPGTSEPFEVFGRDIVIQPPDFFQQQLDLEQGKSKTLYTWIMTATGWAYAGPLTVFQSKSPGEVEAMVAARFGGGPDEHIIIEAPDHAEASRLFNLLSRFHN